MLIQVKGEKIKFTKMELIVLEQRVENLFESFDKKTLHELTLQKKYDHLQEEVRRHAQHVMNLPAGKALKRLGEHLLQAVSKQLRRSYIYTLCRQWGRGITKAKRDLYDYR